MSESSHVRIPVQDRSRQTLERIVIAVEGLLARKPFDEIGVAEVVRRAGCSTGSFYARFRAKDDVLPYLYERYDADLKQRVQARIDSVSWERLGLSATVDNVVRITVEMYSERRHLLRAVALFARSQPGAISPEVRRKRAATTTDLPARVLARFADEIRHDDPLDAARIGFFIVAAAAREKILFGDAPHASDTRLSETRLITELSRTLYAYLTCR
ncbi:MAG TPA: TetR/AcrR family transcriptional regulator [Gemmatimonadaceae bacterium]|nr:TetR/AcrR family transcriptional regulator [Gemmatimonadaceae bacterium]